MSQSAVCPLHVERHCGWIMTQNGTKFMDSAMALAETLHLTKGARRLRISQPQLTKNIQELEDTLGVCLFDRDRKTVTINDAGRGIP